MLLASSRDRRVQSASFHVLFELLVPERVQILAQFARQLPCLARRKFFYGLANLGDRAHNPILQRLRNAVISTLGGCQKGSKRASVNPILGSKSTGFGVDSIANLQENGPSRNGVARCSVSINEKPQMTKVTGPRRLRASGRFAPARKGKRAQFILRFCPAAATKHGAYVEINRCSFFLCVPPGQLRGAATRECTSSFRGFGRSGQHGRRPGEQQPGLYHDVCSTRDG